MNIHLVLFYIGSCCLLLGGCSSTQPQIQVNARRSNVPLVAASGNATGNVGALKKLMQPGVNINQKDKWGRTALMEAALVNYDAAVELLRQKGAKVDLKDNGGSTALLLAAASGNTESARLLLKHGADVNVKNQGDTPLIAAIDNRTEITQGLGAGRPYEPLDTIRLLLENGVDVHAKGRNGKTALMVAKERNIKSTIALLKKAGAKY